LCTTLSRDVGGHRGTCRLVMGSRLQRVSCVVKMWVAETLVKFECDSSPADRMQFACVCYEWHVAIMHDKEGVELSAPYTIYICFLSPLQTPNTRVRGGLMTLSMMPYSRASDVSKYLLRLKSCWICAARPRVRPPSQDPPCWPTLAGNRRGLQELKDRPTGAHSVRRGAPGCCNEMPHDNVQQNDDHHRTR